MIQFYPFHGTSTSAARAHYAPQYCRIQPAIFYWRILQYFDWHHTKQGESNRSQDPTIKQEMLSCFLLQVGSSTKISITCMCFSIFTSCFRFLFSIQTRSYASCEEGFSHPLARNSSSPWSVLCPHPKWYELICNTPWNSTKQSRSQKDDTSCPVSKCIGIL